MRAFTTSGRHQPPTMKLLAIFAALLITTATCNYFFNNEYVDGLSERQWFSKCKRILNATKRNRAVFDIRPLCTKLHCKMDCDQVFIEFDYCVRSQTQCTYADPDPRYPYPECCPKAQCNEPTWKQNFPSQVIDDISDYDDLE